MKWLIRKEYSRLESFFIGLALIETMHFESLWWMLLIIPGVFLQVIFEELGGENDKS